MDISFHTSTAHRQQLGDGALSDDKLRTAAAKDGERKIRINLISVPYGEGEQALMPLGLMSIAAYVEANLGARASCSVYDFSDMAVDDISIIDGMLENEPDLVGISVYSSNAQNCAAWADRIRKRSPNVIVFGGGPHVSLVGREFVSEFPTSFDVVFQGEGEKPTVALALAVLSAPATPIGECSKVDYADLPNAIYFDGCRVREGKKASWQLSSTEWANPLIARVQTAKGRRLLFSDRRDKVVRNAVALTSSRGCPLRCSFCAIIAADKGDKRWRGLEADALIEWLKSAYEARPFEHVYLMDANFFVKPGRVLAFATALFEAFSGRVTWSTSSTVGYLLKVESILPVLVQKGLRLVELGIEAGSNAQLKLFNKSTTVDENIRAISALRRNRVDLGFDFIMFHHLQAIDDIQENLRFIIRANLTQHESLDFYFNLLMLYPGTPLRTVVLSSAGVDVGANKMPDGRSLIQNLDVRWVYEKFIDVFAKPLFQTITDLIDTLQVVNQSGSAKDRSRRRLGVVYLRHLPFHALWTLCELAKKDRKEEAELAIMGLTRGIKVLQECAAGSLRVASSASLHRTAGGRRGEVGTVDVPNR